METRNAFKKSRGWMSSPISPLNVGTWAVGAMIRGGGGGGVGEGVSTGDGGGAGGRDGRFVVVNEPPGVADREVVRELPGEVVRELSLLMVSDSEYVVPCVDAFLMKRPFRRGWFFQDRVMSLSWDENG